MLFVGLCMIIDIKNQPNYSLLYMEIYLLN